MWRRKLGSPTLELKFQGQLHRSGPANLVEGRLTAQNAPAAHACCQHRERAPKRTICDIAIWRAEDRVIENVEELGAELKMNFVTYVELPPECSVQLPHTESKKGVS